MSDPTRATSRWVPIRGDVWLATALFVTAVLSTALGSVAGIYSQTEVDLRLALLYALGVTAPLAWRRRLPSTVAVAVSIAFFLGMMARIPELYVGNVAVFIAFYTVGAWVDDRRRAFIVRMVIIVGMFIWLLVTMFIDATAPTDEGLSRAGLFSPYVAFMLIQFLVNVAFFGGAYYFGNRTFESRRQRAVLAERTVELERERETTAAQAVALDRVRIARELHDVVAHHVSAMGVQAAAARTVWDADPDAARRALVDIEQAARDALVELRQLLETLRTPVDDDPIDASTVGLDGLAALIAHANENVLPTTLAIIGEPVPVAPTVQVNAFRITQEALTNARRHGGPDAEADVRVRYLPEALEVEIVNSGRPALTSHNGLGLLGMRERAAASGGSLEISPRRDGGFRVRLTVPRPGAVGT